MRPARRPRATRSLVVGAAVLLPLLAVPSGAALAEEAPPQRTVVGELVQAWPEHRDHDEAATEPLTWIETAAGDAVRVPAEDLAEELADDEPAPAPLPEALPAPDAELPVGATVRVTVGGEVADPADPEEEPEPARAVLAADVVEAAPAAVASTAPASTPTNVVTVVMMAPKGSTPDGTSLASVVEAVNGPVAQYWDEQSGGAVRLAVGATRDWFQGTVDCTDAAALWKQAAAQAGWTRGAGKHLLVHLPSSAPGCEDGLAEVGASLSGGGRLYVSEPMTSILAHEFGHNVGLGHSSSVRCDGAVDDGDCRVVPYDDWYDVMGVSWEQTGSLSAPQADLIGLLPPGHQATLETTTAPVAARLAPISTRSTSSYRGLALRDRDGTKYWLEYRSAAGRDAWLGTAGNTRGLDAGVLLRVDSAGNDTALLLDGTPSPRSGWTADRQMALPIGAPVSIAGGDFTVRVDAVGAGEALVRVEGSGHTTPVNDRWLNSGGATGSLGEPVGPEECGLAGGGCVRFYEAGVVAWTPATGALVVEDPAVLDRWLAQGAEAGKLGYPVEELVCGVGADGTGCRQRFQRGSVYLSSSTGVRVVKGAIRTRWTAMGAEESILGLPITEERCGLRDGGCYQTFERGSVYWSRASGAHSVEGQMLHYWSRNRWEAGAMGYPVTDMICGLKGGGCYQRFQGATLYKESPSRPVLKVAGAIGRRYAAGGFETRELGFPRSEETCVGGGCHQTFQGGEIGWSPRGGAHLMRGAIRDRWFSFGIAVAVGYPTTEEMCGLPRGGCYQRFSTGARMYWSAATGAHPVRTGEAANPIDDAWAAQGWESGSLGYPLEAPSFMRQRFQGGTLEYTFGTRRIVRR